MRLGSRFFSAALLASLVLASSSLWAQEKVADLKPLVGRWGGHITNQQGTAPIDLTINDDGSWNAITYIRPPLATKGTVNIVDGKAITKNESDGKTGMLSLYVDGKGKETLKGTRDDGSYSTEYQRKK